MKLRHLVACSVLMLLVFLPAAQADEKVYNLQCDSTPPWIYFDTKQNKVVGIWADTIRAAMKTMGARQEEFVIHPWARLLEMGLKGEVDGVFGAIKNEERQKSMWFPDEPLSEDPWVFWIRKADEGKLTFTSLDDLKGHRVALVRDYSYTKELWDFVRAEKNYEEVSHDSVALRMLAMGRVDYVVSTLRFGGYLAGQEGVRDTIMPLTATPLTKSVFYIMFNKQRVDEAWVRRFSDHLKRFKASPNYADILKSYE